MSKDKIIITLLGILGVVGMAGVSILGWIAVKVWDMTPQVAETTRRVDRIVEVLPEVRVRIAVEDLEKRIRVVLLTTEPTEISRGKWAAAVHYLDFASGVQKTYRATLKGPNDYQVALLVTGLANRTARDKLTFEEFSAAASASGRPSTVPPYLDQSASFAILRARVDYEEQLKALLGAPVKESALPKGTIKWEQLASDLTAREATLRLQ